MTQAPPERTVPVWSYTNSRRDAAIQVLPFVCIVALSLLPFPLFAQRGVYTAPANIDQMTKQARTILVGHVISTKVEPHPQFANLRTVIVSLKVDRVLKGDAGSVFQFRQLLWDARDTANSAGYQKAGDLLLFLNPVSTYGLTSPVGMEQGLFRILRDSKGNQVAVNGRDNRGLFDQIASKVQERGLVLSKQAAAVVVVPRGPVPLQGLESLIQTLASSQR